MDRVRGAGDQLSELAALLVVDHRIRCCIVVSIGSQERQGEREDRREIDAFVHARSNRVAQVRLQQDAFNVVSLSLYASLGFESKHATAATQPGLAAGDDGSVASKRAICLPSRSFRGAFTGQAA
jgi:hypothetical protein